MKIAGIIFLLFVSLSGMAQQAESSKEYVIKAWNEFQLPEKGAIKAILAQRDQITRYLKANNAAVEAEQENGAQAIRRAADLYDEGEDAQLKSSEIKKLLKGVDLSTKEFVSADIDPSLTPRCIPIDEAVEKKLMIVRPELRH